MFRDRPDLCFEIGKEEATTNAVLAILDVLVEVAAPIWHIGDGEGGFVIRSLFDAARARGLPTAETRSAAVTTSPSRRPVSTNKAARVFARDGLRCVHCGDTETLSIDHIYPVSKGGTNDEENLQTLCRSCNSRKGAKLPEGM